jgi:RNA polymerase sigma-70 factor, ECF subfamily
VTESEITRLLASVNEGDPEALEQLIGTIYGEMRRMSAALMRREAAGHTLQPTALVNEAFIRLIQGDPRWVSRAHFFGAAARAMRRILVEHARAKSAQKRGGEAHRITFEDLSVASEDNQIDLLALDQALQALEKTDPRLARVVELRYFAGCSIEETAELLAVSVATVKRDWAYAKAWLYDFMEGSRGQAEEPAH